LALRCVYEKTIDMLIIIILIMTISLGYIITCGIFLLLKRKEKNAVQKIEIILKPIKNAQVKHEGILGNTDN
jgi:hypothetical protein